MKTQYRIIDVGKGILDITSENLHKVIQPDLTQADVLLINTPPTRVDNTFTYPANSYKAIINNIVYINNEAFTVNIVDAPLGYSRVDIVYITAGGIIGYIKGVESQTNIIYTTLPAGFIALSNIAVNGDIIEDPLPVVGDPTKTDKGGYGGTSLDLYNYIQSVDYRVSATEFNVADLTIRVDAIELNKEDKANKGVANGYAPLDGSTKIPLIYINDALLGNVNWKGLYNGTIITSSPDAALVGQPLPTPSSTNKGWYFISSTDYTYSGIDYRTGDWIISNGITWDKVDNTDAVSSVFGRVGNVTAQNGDYTASQITNVPSGNISSITVQAALNELDSEKAIDANVVHLAGDETITGVKTFNNKIVTSNWLEITNSTPISSYTNNVIGRESSFGNIFMNTTGKYPFILDGSNISSSAKTFTFPNQSGTFALTNNPSSITATSFIKSGAPSTNILLAGGSDIPQSTFVPSTRTININGVTQDLSANRSYRAGLSNTGALTYAGSSVASATTINVGAVTGVITDNETTPNVPSYQVVTYAGGTNITVPTLASGTGTYVLLNNAGTLVFQNTFPTSAQRKSMIYLSKISHPNLSSISFIIDEPDFVNSPLQQFRDLFQVIQYMNQGITISGTTGLTINSTNGVILGDGINFVLDKTNPNMLTVAAGAPRNFLLLNQSGAVGSFVTTIDPANYDVGGVTTPIGGSVNSSTIQYLYYAPGVGFAILRGQTVYGTLLEAVSAVGRESFVLRPNLVNNSILIAAICLRRTTTAMNDPAYVRILLADKFGQIGGASSGISVTNLQTAYNNSLIPQITTTLGAFTLKEGGASNTDNVFAIQNLAGSVTASINGNGAFTGTSWNGYTPANEATVLHNVGNESFTGVKTAINSGGTLANGLNLVNNGTNSTGVLAITNGSSGRGLYAENLGSGNLITANTVTAGTGFNYVGQNNATNTFTVDKLGVVTGTSFVKSGATTTNILLAGGTDIPQSTFALASGSGSYIQNQNASAQSANMWISGNGRFNGELLIDDGVNGRLTLGTGAAQNDIHSTTTAFGAYKDLRFTATKFLFNLGNVGIGTTTSPDAKLDVESTVAGGLSDALTITNLSSTANSEVGLFFSPTIATGNIRGSRISSVNDGNNAIDLRFTTGNGATITEKMRITPTGNVLIGTTTDAGFKLRVQGDSGQGIQFGTNAGTNAVLGAFDTHAYIGTTSNHPAAFYVGSAEKMRIDISGNVLIGTTSATSTGGLHAGALNLAIAGSGIQGLGVWSTDVNGTRAKLFVDGGGGNWGLWHDGSALKDFVIGGFNSEWMRIAFSGIVNIPNLAGTGTRTVVADASGNLSTVASSTATSGSYTPATIGIVEYEKSYWTRVGNIITLKLNFTLNAVGGESLTFAVPYPPGLPEVSTVAGRPSGSGALNRGVITYTGLVCISTDSTNSTVMQTPALVAGENKGSVTVSYETS